VVVAARQYPGRDLSWRGAFFRSIFHAIFSRRADIFMAGGSCPQRRPDLARLRRGLRYFGF